MPQNEYIAKSLGVYVTRTFRALSAQANRSFSEAGYDITGEQWRVLLYLWNEDGLTQAELCERLLQDKTGVSRLLDGLERRGYLRRETDQRDRRCKRVYLTPKGRAAEAPLVALAEKGLEISQRGLDEQEMAVCRKVLASIFHNVNGEDLIPACLTKSREK